MKRLTVDLEAKVLVVYTEDGAKQWDVDLELAERLVNFASLKIEEEAQRQIEDELAEQEQAPEL